MKILYGGIGCNKSGEHTEEEFLAIMKNEFTTHNWAAEIDVINDLAEELEVMPPKHYQLDFKDWVLPDDYIFFTLNDWIEYSGAIIDN